MPKFPRILKFPNFEHNNLVLCFFKVVSHFLNFLNFEMSNTENLQAIDRLVAAGGISYPSI